MTTTPHLAPWDRRPDESAQAFEAFAKYRDLGVDRSLAKVSAALGKSEALMARWSSRHQWVIRAASWDNEQDRLWQLELRKQRRAFAKRNLSTAGLAMQKFGETLLSIDATRLEAGEAARLADVALKIQRAAFGEPDVHVTTSGGPGDGTSTAGAAAALTDEERLARMEMLRRELSARLSENEEASAS